MRRLKVAVDCDDVLLPSLISIIDIYNQRYDTNVQYEDAYIAANGWQALPETIADRIYDIQLSEEYARIRPFDDAIDACKRLSEIHTLDLVTARPGKLMALTLDMLNNYFPGAFSEIEHIGLNGSKGDVCRRLRADVMIDDNIKHLETAFGCGVRNLIWFGDYPWQHDGVGANLGGVVRCPGWSDVEQEIERIASQ